MSRRAHWVAGKTELSTATVVPKFWPIPQGYGRSDSLVLKGFQKGGGCEGGGEISIIGVVRTPVAISNSASNPSENL